MSEFLPPSAMSERLEEIVRTAQARAGVTGRKVYVKKKDWKTTFKSPPMENLEVEVYPGGRIVYWGGMR